ncbi:MAG: bifunctional oligoribonuclease/PAP phosphatase NrnA [Candidatus Omnitrophota bacterium]|nr:bifunctional oligoribonuclease/PAP phosphatase NrnA [Candidatus Omnitrophota bacterium]
MSLKTIIKALKRYDRFLITSHHNIETDALGSELALANWLKANKKKFFIVNQDFVPLAYRFLPGIKSVFNLPKIKSDLKFDAVIILDCSNFDRIGTVKGQIFEDKPTINIDHHRSNENFGNFNWVKPTASSTAEMIYEIYKASNVKISKKIALLLYTGIMTDTGSFRFENTTSFTHKVISELLKFKIPIKDIYHKIYESFAASEMRLFCNVIKDFKIDKSKRIAWLELELGLLDEQKSKLDLNDAIFNILRSIETVEVAIIFRESKKKDSVRVNFRSQGKVNVGKLAYSFGGGGHRAASGCVIKGNLRQVTSRVFKRINKLLK